MGPHPEEYAMPSRLSRWFATVASLGFVVAPLAFGQPVDPGKPCAADAQKLCPGVKPGQGALLACLEPKQDKISQACKDSVKAKLQALVTACAQDVQKFCDGVPMGTGKVIQCLDKNAAGLNDNCKAEFAKVKAAAPPPQ
jgi:hypothetical protein